MVLILVKVLVLVIGFGSDEHTAAEAMRLELCDGLVEWRKKTLSTYGVGQPPLRRRSESQRERERKRRGQKKAGGGRGRVFFFNKSKHETKMFKFVFFQILIN